MSKTLTWAPDDAARPWNVALLYLVAALLRRASAVLDRAALNVSAVAAQDGGLPAGVVEFHSIHREAGAPEGAIYVDGKLHAIVPGVTRW